MKFPAPERIEVFTPRYVVFVDEHEQRGIFCLSCGYASFDAGDIENRYCARCNAFHNDLYAGEPANVFLRARKGAKP